MPPSAMTGTPWRIAASAHSKTAVICGTPTPATTRVVQIEPGPIPHLDRVRARVDQRLRRLGGRDVAGDHLDVPLGLDTPHHLDDGQRVAVGGVDDEHVDLGGDERARALERVRADADRGSDPEPALLVLRRERELDPLLDVLDGDQAAEAPVRVDDRELLDLVPVQDLVRLLERRPDRRSDEVARGHQRGNGLARVRLEAEVAVRQDPDEHAGLVGDRHARDAVARHQLERVRDEVVRAQRHGLDDHPRLGALDLVDLGDLVGDREVAVQDPRSRLRARARSRAAPR